MIEFNASGMPLSWASIYVDYLKKVKYKSFELLRGGRAKKKVQLDDEENNWNY